MPQEVFIIIILIFLSAIFSGLETAILGLGSLNIVRGDQQKLKKLFNKKQKLLITFLIANNLTIVGSTLTLNSLLITQQSSNNTLYTLFIFTAYIVIFFIVAEVLPKAIFRRLDLWILRYFYYIILLFYYLFFIFTTIFIYFTDIIVKILHGKKDLTKKNKKNDIFYFLGSQILDEDDPITGSLMTLRITKAREIMTPLADIYLLNIHSQIKDSYQVIEETLYTRYPVYENRGDNIIGYIEVYDYFENPPSTYMKQIIHPPIFIPEFLTADEILFKMQNEKIPILFVVNEFGSVIGMITLEDIAEEIVGEIISEEQEKEELYIEKKGNNYILDGNLDIDDFNKYFPINIEKEEFETISGYIQKKTGKILQKNESFTDKRINFIIKEADSKVIYKVLVEFL